MEVATSQPPVDNTRVATPPVVVSGSAWVQPSSMEVVTSQPLVATADDWVALLIEDELRRKEAAALDDLDAVLTGSNIELDYKEASEEAMLLKIENEDDTVMIDDEDEAMLLAQPLLFE